MSKWSENYKFKNPDITEIADNVSRIMGIDSGASGRRRDTMGNILTGAKTEGQIAKNVKLNAIAELAKRIFAAPELTRGDKYSQLISTGSGDYETGRTKRGTRPSEIKKSESLASKAGYDSDVAGGKAERDQMITTLAKNLMTRSDVDSPEYKRIAEQLGTLRGDTRTSAAVNLGMIGQEEKEAGFKTDTAETNLNIRKEVLNFLPKKQAEKLKNLENITKASEKKIKIQESKLETEKDRQELLEARTKQVRDLRAEKVLILKAKGKAQKAKNNSLVKELEAKQKELDLKIEVQEQKIKTEKTRSKTAESKLEEQELKTKATPEILRQKLEKTGLEIKRLAEQLKGDVSDSERKRLNTELAEKTQEYKITKTKFEAMGAEDDVRLKNVRIMNALNKGTSGSTVDTDATVDAMLGKPGGGDTAPPTPRKSASLPFTPKENASIQSIMTGLLNAPDLKQWNPEQEARVIKTMMQKHNLTPQLIKRLIDKAKQQQQIKVNTGMR